MPLHGRSDTSDRRLPILAFAHIEKCGGTTLIHILRREFGLDHFDVIPRDKSALIFGPDDLRSLLRLRPGVKSLAGHSIRPASRLEEVVANVRYYTVLREPCARYVSDFRHFVDFQGFPDDFPRWLSREDRHDFQTRAIAGGPDLDEAKRLLEARFDLVGVLDGYEEFLAGLRAIAQPFELRTHYRIRNRTSARRSRSRPQGASTASGRRSGADDPDDLDEFEAEIRARNRLDRQLYDFVRTELIPRQRERLALDEHAECQSPPPRGRLREALRPRLNRLYRNLVYKPYMGYSPFRPHALPPYRRAPESR